MSKKCSNVFKEFYKKHYKEKSGSVKEANEINLELKSKNLTDIALLVFYQGYAQIDLFALFCLTGYFSC